MQLWRGGVVAILLTCSAAVRAQTATAWPEADRLFHSDPRWLGSDAAFSVDLGHGRVLWIFNDTWIARPGSHTRRNAWFVRNTLGIEQGYNPAHAKMHFFWRTHHGKPTEIYPSEGKAWMWPAAGTRIGGTVVLFAERLLPDASPQSMGFKADGWNAYTVANPDADPDRWKLKKFAEMHDSVILGSSVLLDGGFAYLFGVADPTDDLCAARVRQEALARGDLSGLTWWNGRDWGPDRSARVPALRHTSTEASIQRNPRGRGFVMVTSRGFGATDIVMSTAPAINGPWTKQQVVYRPPESDQPHPFVYAGKSHPELLGADLVVTYATNSLDNDISDDMTRYFPRFVRVTLH